jgi:hypothetical protein
MKRMHLHVAVDDLARSVGFYSTLFGASPSVLKSDYAKWMLDDPRVNFAISMRAQGGGIDHIGIQAETSGEFAEIATRLKQAGEHTLDQQAANCCYAQSDKTWASDPSGVRWETFHTLGEATVYGEDHDPAGVSSASACTPASACCAR